MIKKIKQRFRFWDNDYTFLIYVTRILGYVLTFSYLIITFFDKKKTRKFNIHKNYFVLKRRELIKEYNEPADEEFRKKFLKKDRYDFNGIFIPKIENTNLLRSVYSDTFKIYTEMNDNYHYSIVDEVDKIIPEGSYCYIGPNNEDITIKPNYTVIDAGAWLGDFSSYAAKKGAHAYAFEPSPSNIKLLEKTIEYNEGWEGKITIVPFGLGNKEEILEFYENEESENTGGNSFRIPEGTGNIKLNIVTLDGWAEKNNINKIDFIKADIEGYERNMLLGATKTLQIHEPILSICTYHNSDDSVVLKKIILDANPKYNIIQRKMKLFAYVNKN